MADAARGYRSRMLGREAMYRRSLALLAAVADGWDDDRIACALASVDVEMQGRLTTRPRDSLARPVDQSGSSSSSAMDRASWPRRPSGSGPFTRTHHRTG